MDEEASLYFREFIVILSSLCAKPKSAKIIATSRELTLGYIEDDIYLAFATNIT